MAKILARMRDASAPQRSAPHARTGQHSHCGAVFPLYYTGHQIQRGRTDSRVSVSDFMKYTTANLPRGSWKYWCVGHPEPQLEAR